MARAYLTIGFPAPPEVAVARIAQRVRKAGHFIPRQDVERRFLRPAGGSLENAR